jgi:hypothetical protein
MIVSGDDPKQGRKAQRLAGDSTISPGSSSAKRHRLAHILDADNVAIIVTNLRIQAGIPQDRFSR